MKNTAYISIGSNIGKREMYLIDAISNLNKLEEVSVIRHSSIYETDPVGYEDQSSFLNMVLEIETTLSPQQLLTECLMIEKGLGRKRIIRWGPRTVDLDILLYNHENIETDSLIIPHPRLTERAFVVIPLAEINPDLSVPGTGKTVKEIAEILSDKGVRLWKLKAGEDGFVLFES